MAKSNKNAVPNSSQKPIKTKQNKSTTLKSALKRPRESSSKAVKAVSFADGKGFPVLILFYISVLTFRKIEKKEKTQKHVIEGGNSSDEAPEEVSNEAAKLLSRKPQITELPNKNINKKQKKLIKPKVQAPLAVEVQDLNEPKLCNSLPTPLPLEVLFKAENKTSVKPLPIFGPENHISSTISPENLKQKNKKLQKAKTQKNFGGIKVKVLTGRNPWDLPPIRIDKGANDFLQNALYGNRSHTRQRKQIGLSLGPNVVGPAPKFVREIN
ncbi:hypothetical protein DSO57_1038603 [Entomophthora muscae]|uniref:Uncharacterized protein n=1 Tax=Entomophthora muscae TaxID=34485 RepID=A0ACC2SYT1_9FUNG|nr:hypothetical protein DSO57_1038603 [Entomophthora muscae]